MRTPAQEGAVSSTKRQGEGLVVSMIDAGLTAELNDEDRRNFLDLFAALVRNDGRHIGRLMIERNSKNSQRGVPLSQVQSQNFQDRMHEVVSSVHESGLALGRMSICDILQKVLVACYESGVKLDSKFVSVMLALGVMEGMGRRLDPDVDLLKAAAPQVLKASAKFGLYYAAQKLRDAQREHEGRHPSRASLRNLSANQEQYE
jgi:aarF domain-containing kinase